jgi:DNA-directed RNA polymerase III subunit RPC2
MKIQPRAVLVNREMPLNTTDTMQNPDLPEGGFKSAPLTYKGPDVGAVEKVMLSSSESEMCIIKVSTRDVRRPELGDKFSSRHGQKGVCGLIVGQEDMPFNVSVWYVGWLIRFVPVRC